MIEIKSKSLEKIRKVFPNYRIYVFDHSKETRKYFSFSPKGTGGDYTLTLSLNFEGKSFDAAIKRALKNLKLLSKYKKSLKASLDGGGLEF